jgi:alpha-1,3-rhamnosyl/mannosyltransferase
LRYLVGDRITADFNTDIQGILPLRNSGHIRQLLKKVLPEELLLRAYRKRKTAKLAGKLSAYEDYIFHSPNFSLPPHPGKSVVTLHDLSVFHFPQFHPADRVSFLRDQIRASVEHADMLVTDSEFVRSELISLFGVAERRVCSVPLGVDPNFRPREEAELETLLRKYGLGYKQYLLSVGTIEPRKNLPGLLRAYLQLDRSLRESCPLVIVGAYGWGSREFIAELEPLVESGEVIYLNYVPECDLPAIFSGAEVFCYMSFYEGFGLPVLEAMSAGVPVVCSDSSALPELCSGAALQVDATDDQAIAFALNKSLADGAWREQSAASGLDVSKHYRWDVTAEKMIDIYSRLEA